MELLNYLLGTKSLSFYLAALIFFVLGQIINKFVVFKRRPTKEEFDIQYWVKDNYLDVLITLLLGYITVRFTGEIISVIHKFIPIDLSFVVDEMFYYLMVGLLYQSLLQILRKNMRFLRSKYNGQGLKREDIINP